MKSGHNPISRRENIVVQEVADELLIYDLAEGKALCLNETSKMVWQQCDGTNSVSDIGRILSNRLKTVVSEDIVWLALNQLKKDDLLEAGAELITPFDGMNRREIVKKIGFASLVALPLISAVMAPSAVAAQSAFCGCVGTAGTRSFSAGCSCTMNNDCCSNVCGAGGTICTLLAVNPAGAAACCNAAACPPANGTNVPPGCGCNGNGNCASNVCSNGICRI